MLASGECDGMIGVIAVKHTRSVGEGIAPPDFLDGEWLFREAFAAAKVKLALTYK